MNQNERDDLAIYLGLQEFEVALVGVEASRRRGRIKVMSLARRSGAHRCPDCGREHAEGLFAEAESIRFRDCSIGDFETYRPTWKWSRCGWRAAAGRGSSGCGSRCRGSG
jgi:hypothetical protein